MNCRVLLPSVRDCRRLRASDVYDTDVDGVVTDARAPDGEYVYAVTSVPVVALTFLPDCRRRSTGLSKPLLCCSELSGRSQ